jgi:hypothetical protein
LTAVESPPLSTRRSPQSDQEIAIAILRDLFERKDRGDNSAVSVHALSGLSGIPTQRDQRVKEILVSICERGYIEQIRIDERMGYRMTPEGERFWRANGPILVVFFGIRRKPLR